jgi:hypothetical protein
MTVEIEYSRGAYAHLFAKPINATPTVIYARRSAGNAHILFGYDIDNICVDWMQDTDDIHTILEKWPLVSFIE